jgi:hypothetical protein
MMFPIGLLRSLQAAHVPVDGMMFKAVQWPCSLPGRTRQ